MLQLRMAAFDRAETKVRRAVRTEFSVGHAMRLRLLRSFPVVRVAKHMPVTSAATA